jgi:programmed cell death 6-interacting protein
LIPRISSTVLEQEIKQTFHWNDAFQATKKSSFMSLYYEMAAVIWNLGALESLRGGRLDRSTDEGIRMAAKSFQYAAGCFDYILTTILPSLPSTIVNQCPCFTAECLNMVKQLMLAQAQLCFYEKAVRDKKKDLMKSAIIAKLAAQVAIFYQQACSSTKAGSIVQILDISWFAITDYQSKSFQAAKEYWQAMASKELANTKGSGYGEEVARYIRAEQLVRQAMEVCRKFNLQSTLQAGADALLQAITANRTQALHDLNTVYMEAVTPDHGLVDVPPVAMVKATPFHVSTDAAGAGEDVMFQYILPREFIVVMRKFYDEVSSTHSRCQDQVLDATNLGRMTLSSVGLPASIEACKVSSTNGGSGMEVPDSVWQRIREIQATKGGVHLLRESYEQIVKASRRALQTVQTIQECLLDAEQKDDQFRVRYPYYPGQRMVEMNQEIRGNVAKFQHALSNAQANDEVLRLEIFSDAMSQLALSKDEINRFLQQSVQTAQHPTITVVASGTVDLLDLLDEPVTATTTIPTSSSAALANGYTFQSPEMLTLEEKLHDLAGLFESRQQDLNRLKQLGAIDLSKELNISIGTANASDQIYQKYSQEVRTLDTSIQSSVSQQDALIAEIVRLNEIFVRQREADPTLKAKNQVIQGLEQAVGKFTALQQQLTSGQTFYSNLQVS